MKKIDIPKRNVTWSCPLCHRKDNESFIDVESPLCSGCHKEIQWGDILTSHTKEE